MSNDVSELARFVLAICPSSLDTIAGEAVQIPAAFRAKPINAWRALLGSLEENMISNNGYKVALLRRLQRATRKNFKLADAVGVVALRLILKICDQEDQGSAVVGDPPDGVPALIFLDDDGNVKHFLLPKTKKEASDVMDTCVAAILSYFPWIDFDRTDELTENTLSKLLYQIAVDDEPANAARADFEFVFHANPSVDEVESMETYRTRYFECIQKEGEQDSSLTTIDVYLTVSEWNESMTMYLPGLGAAQANFLMMVGTMRRNQKSQITAQRIELTSSAILDKMLDTLVCFATPAAIDRQLRDEVKKQEKQQEEDEEAEGEAIVVNLGTFREARKEELAGLSIREEFAFALGKKKAKSHERVFALETESTMKLCDQLSKAGYFESVAPNTESMVIACIVKIVGGQVKSYFSNKRPYSSYLYRNFVMEGCYIEYNENPGKFGFTDNLFRVHSNHMSFKTIDDQYSPALTSSGKENVHLEDYAYYEEKADRLKLAISEINASRFSFPVNICHLLGNRKNSSRFVDANLLYSTAGVAEFKILKSGLIKMHIPVSRHVGHLQSPEAAVADEMDIEATPHVSVGVEDAKGAPNVPDEIDDQVEDQEIMDEIDDEMEDQEINDETKERMAKQMKWYVGAILI